MNIKDRLSKIGDALTLLVKKRGAEEIEYNKRTKEMGFADFLMYHTLPRKNIMMDKSGGLSAYYVYQGPDVDSTTDSALDILVTKLSHAYRILGDDWMVEFNPIRTKVGKYPHNCDFPETVSGLIDEERRRQYEAEGSHYVTSYYLTVSRGAKKELSYKVKNFFIESDEEIVQETIEEYIEDFEGTLNNFIGILSGYLRIERLEGDDILTFINYCITQKHQKVAVPYYNSFLNEYLSNEDFVSGTKPKIGNKYIAVLNFEDYPVSSFPTMLDFMNDLKFEYRWSSRFIALSTETAKSYISSHIKNWNQKAKGVLGLIKDVIDIPNTHLDADAAAMASDAEIALTENSAGLLRYGFITRTVIIMDEDIKRLNENIEIIRNTLQHDGFLIRVETVNAVEAFLGSIPGHGYYNIRRPMMDSYALAQTTPVTGIYQGEIHCPCKYYGKDQPSLFIAKTKGETPYFFNPHVSDVGHTLIAGPTGGGKTTLLGLMIAQHRKYKDSQIFVFDKDNSNKIVLNALNGGYYDFGSKKAKITCAPLQNIDDDEEFGWACSYIEMLCELQEVKCTPKQKGYIRDGLEVLRTTESEYWTIEYLINNLQDESGELREALSYYTAKEGVIGRLLNNAVDNVEVDTVFGLELGWLLGQTPQIYVPVIEYFFRKLHKIFKKRKPTLFILEEAWLYFDNKLIAPKIKDWLKTLRKFNVSVIITTQSLSDIANSTIRTVLVESCLTKIYLPNDQASGDSKSIYESFNLNSRQIAIISAMETKCDYYVTNSLGNRIIDLNLGELSLAFIGVSSDADIEKFNELYTKDDESWIPKWLEYKNLSSWADHLRNMKQNTLAALGSIMYKKITILSISVLCMFMLSANIFAWGFDVVTFTGTAQAMTADNMWTNDLHYLNSVKSLAEEIADDIVQGKMSWKDVSGAMNELNSAANVGKSIAYSNAAVIQDFQKVFPGMANDTTNYLENFASRTTTALDTFQGALSAAKMQGNMITGDMSADSSLKRLLGSQSRNAELQAVGQIEGQVANELEMMRQAQLSNLSADAAYHSFKIQQAQTQEASQADLAKALDVPFRKYIDDGFGYQKPLSS